MASPAPSASDPIIQITIPVLTKLARSNFLTWKSQIEPIVNDFGLFHHLDDSEAPAPFRDVDGVATANPNFPAWQKQDQFLLGWLRSSITVPVRAQCMACRTARDLWKSLHRVYSAVSKAKIMELRRLLQCTTQGGKSCNEYFELMRSYADQLSVIGEPITDADLVSHILNGLGSDYNAFVISLTTHSDSISPDDVHGFLLSYEALLNTQHTSHTTQDPLALYSATEKNSCSNQQQFAPRPPNQCGRGRGRDQNRMDPNKGNLFYITNMDPLSCQNNGCSNPLKVPIRQCLSGHLFCFNCHHGHLKCMLCPENILFPAPSLDAILNTIMDGCPNKLRGCNEKIHFYEVIYHVENCKYSHLTCPIPRCFHRFGSGYLLESHLTRNHKTHVDSFSFGVPTRFAFEMHGETRILIESETRLVFVVHYVVGRNATLFYFFCVNFCGDLQFKYKITNRRGGSALLVDTPVPITTLKDGVGAIRLGGSLSHELRTGKSKVLYCNFVIDTINPVPKT